MGTGIAEPSPMNRMRRHSSLRLKPNDVLVGVRFCDRLMLRAGLVAERQAWNDMAKFRPGRSLALLPSNVTCPKRAVNDPAMLRL